MARIKSSSSKNNKSYSIIEDYNRNGKRTTKIVDYIGNHNQILKLAQEQNIDIDTWLNNYLAQYRKEHHLIPKSESEKVIIEKYANKLIPKNVNHEFNVGYLFLEDIYYSLKLDKIVKSCSKKYKFEFDLNEVLSNLIFARIINLSI